MPFLPRGTTHDIPKFEINLDNEVVVFRGTRDEAAASVVKGSLLVAVKEQTTIRSIVLVLQGFKRFQWNERPPGHIAKVTQQTPRAFKVEELIYEKKWVFLDGGKHGFDMNPGELVYPFQEVLEGSMLESIEGLWTGSHLVYRFKAKIVRGKLSHDIIAKRHMRIVRTLASTAEELRLTTSCENLWPNKIEYTLSTPSKAVVFGTHVPFNITLVPLLKGLVIGMVTVVLKETNYLNCPQRAGHRIEMRDVATKTYTSGVLEPDSPDADMGMWTMNEIFPLPKSLNECVQDCEVPGIKVRHKLKFVVQLHNPDGHISELRASLPVSLFISPNHLMNESNTIPDDVTYTETSEDLQSAPPCYSEHYLDTLYQNFPRDHYETPFASGANTPIALSRNNSSENIQSLHQALPDINSRRWNRARSPATAGADLQDYFSAQRSGNSTPGHMSRTQSPGPASQGHSGSTSQGHSPELTDDEDDESRRLSQVPSYGTALRSRPPSRDDSDLPQYGPGDGTNRPPVARHNTTGGVLMGHVRHRSDVGVSNRSQSSMQLSSLGRMLEEGERRWARRSVDPPSH